MIADIPQSKAGTRDVVSAILLYCRNENEVLRSAAIRALASQGAGDKKTRQALLAAILDEDPDVRSDAMEALADHALPKDAPVLSASLEGDPVRDVKLAAIRALAKLEDESATQLLRDLMLSRCEDRVAWEDELGDWEDWLDIQTACIQALGGTGASDMIDDMFIALNDEFGQTLDIPVFTALSKMGSDGVPWLLAQIELGGDLARKRAAQALLQAEPKAVLDYADTLLISPDPQLKILIASVLPLSDDRLRALFDDADPAVRCAALKRLAKEHPDLVEKALADSDEQVRATALSSLHLPVSPDFHDALVDNVMAWLEIAKSDLASAAAAILPKLAPDQSAEPLLKMGTSEERPLEVRVTAVKALATITSPETLTNLTGLLSNPAQQVRVAALHGLKQLAEHGEQGAVSVLAETITGSVLSPEDMVQKHQAEAGADVTVPKGDGFGTGVNRVRITADGDIVTDSAELPGAATPVSTLDAIQFEVQADTDESPALAEDTPEESSFKRRKRRSVEGPEAVGDDLSRVAITIAADLPGAEIETAILARINDADVNLKATSWGQLARRCADNGASKDSQIAAKSALEDSNPVVRLAAFQIIGLHGASAEIQAMALADEDALIRAAGVGMLQPDVALDYITDDASAVRDAALARILEGSNGIDATAAVDRLLQSERIDTLSQVIYRSADARTHAAKALLPSKIPARNALVLLEAFARAGPVRQGFAI